MILTYYPDTDTLDIHFRDTVERQDPEDVVSRGEPNGRTDPVRSETETYEADPSEQILAHYGEGCLDGLTIEHARRRAPETWGIESPRREAARVAATTGRIVESVSSLSPTTLFTIGPPSNPENRVRSLRTRRTRRCGSTIN